MKALFRFSTVLGPRTLIAEIGDRATAQAVVNAHLALVDSEMLDCPSASLVEEMPRLSIKTHMAKHKRTKAKAARQAAVVATSANVTPIRKRDSR